MDDGRFNSEKSPMGTHQHAPKPVGLIAAASVVFLASTFCSLVVGQPSSDSGPATAQDEMAADAIAAAAAGDRTEAALQWDRIESPSVRYDALQPLVASISNQGAGGGGSLADFSTLINLITTTVEPDSWEDNGGVGTIAGFPAGIHVDAAGLVHRRRSTGSTQLASSLASRISKESQEKGTSWRAVSLPRWERAVVRAAISGQPPDAALLSLAGLQRVRYVVVDETHNDLILIGPAADTGPSLTLDAWVTVSHNLLHGSGVFGCSIEPRAERLQATHAFLQASSNKVISRPQRRAWTEQLQQVLGRQDIVVNGVPDDSPTAGILVAADYHMKCIGMGVEPSIPEVPSYLSLLEVGPDGQPPALGVLRWWFTLHYDHLHVNPDKTVYELDGRAAQVLCENEFLSERGERQHTGTADDLNRAYAARFTEHFEALAARFPIYRQLQGVFDLAIVAALVQSDHLADRVHWKPVLSELTASPLAGKFSAPKEVDSIVGQRDLNRRHFVTGISGGVEVNARTYVRQRRSSSEDYQLTEAFARGRADKPYAAEVPQWWWEIRGREQ